MNLITLTLFFMVLQWQMTNIVCPSVPADTARIGLRVAQGMHTYQMGGMPSSTVKMARSTIEHSTQALQTGGEKKGSFIQKLFKPFNKSKSMNEKTLSPVEAKQRVQSVKTVLKDHKANMEALKQRQIAFNNERKAKSFSRTGRTSGPGHLSRSKTM